MAVGSFAEHPTADVVCAALVALVVIYVLSLSCAPVLPTGVPPRGGGVASARQAGLAYEAPAWSTAVSGARSTLRRRSKGRPPPPPHGRPPGGREGAFNAECERRDRARRGECMASETDEVKACLASYDVRGRREGVNQGDSDDFRAKAGDMASHYDSEHGAHMKKAMDPSRADWATTSIMRTVLPKYTLRRPGRRARSGPSRSRTRTSVEGRPAAWEIAYRATKILGGESLARLPQGLLVDKHTRQVQLNTGTPRTWESSACVDRPSEGTGAFSSPWRRTTGHADGGNFFSETQGRDRRTRSGEARARVEPSLVCVSPPRRWPAWWRRRPAPPLTAPARRRGGAARPTRPPGLRRRGRVAPRPRVKLRPVSGRSSPVGAASDAPSSSRTSTATSSAPPSPPRRTQAQVQAVGDAAVPAIEGEGRGPRTTSAR